MSERWWRRRKRFDPWFGDFFEETDRLEEMMRQAFGRRDGKPQIREFDKIQNGLSGESRIWKEPEPLVDMLEHEGEVFIVAELPGVNRDDIQIHSTEDSVTISVDKPQRKYYRKLALPVKVEPRSAVASYKNGVLELRLKKVVDERLFVK